MSLGYTLILAAHILVGIVLIILVLIQHGKGADMGAAFGSGASGSLFGATGSANFLSRATGVLAAIFFATSLTLSYLASNRTTVSGSVMDRAHQEAAQPAKPQVPPAPPAPDSKGSEIPK